MYNLKMHVETSNDYITAVVLFISVGKQLYIHFDDMYYIVFNEHMNIEWSFLCFFSMAIFFYF